MKIRLTELRRIIRQVLLEMPVLTPSELESLRAEEEKLNRQDRKESPKFSGASRESFSDIEQDRFIQGVLATSGVYDVKPEDIVRRYGWMREYLKDYHPSILEFVINKFENEELSYNTEEMRGVALNLQIEENVRRFIADNNPSESEITKFVKTMKNVTTTAGQTIINELKNKINHLITNTEFVLNFVDNSLGVPSNEYLDEVSEKGLQYIPREPIKFVARGSRASGHGTSRYAGQGAGGSGVSSGGIGMGGGPGAVSGTGRTWSANDPTSLGMGARKRLS